MFTMWSNCRGIGVCWVCDTFTHIQWKVRNVASFMAGTGARPGTVSPSGTVFMCGRCGTED
jgi:hypothetical protein